MGCGDYNFESEKSSKVVAKIGDVFEVTYGCNSGERRVIHENDDSELIAVDQYGDLIAGAGSDYSIQDEIDSGNWKLVGNVFNHDDF